MDDYSTILNSIGVVAPEAEEWEKFKAEPWQPDESHGLLVATLTESAADAALLALAEKLRECEMERRQWKWVAHRDVVVGDGGRGVCIVRHAQAVKLLLAQYTEEASDGID